MCFVTEMGQCKGHLRNEVHPIEEGTVDILGALSDARTAMKAQQDEADMLFEPIDQAGEGVDEKQQQQLQQEEEGEEEEEGKGEEEEEVEEEKDENPLGFGFKAFHRATVPIPSNYMELQMSFAAAFPWHDAALSVERVNGKSISPHETKVRQFNERCRYFFS